MEELHLYGSARLGILKKALALRYRDESGTANWSIRTLAKTALAQSSYQQLELGRRRYELSNQLSNVLATLSDKSLGEDSSQTGQADYYLAQVSSANLYYPFGWEMPGRKFLSGEEYRFGFNGKEDDRDWGTQNIQDYGFRLYNPSIGKFLSEDPLAPEYPSLTTYQFASNTPIQAIDLDGLEQKNVIHYLDNNGKIYDTEVRILSNKAVARNGSYYAITHVTKIYDDDRPTEIELYEEEVTARINGRGTTTEIYPSARYDYSNNGGYDDSKKQAEDLSFGFGKMAQALRRDAAAPDNAESLQNIDDAKTAVTAIVPILGIPRWSNRGNLKIAEGGLETSSGLRFGKYSGPDGHRLNHMLKHTKNDLGKKYHGVFDKKGNKLIEQIDEAWEKVQKGATGVTTILQPGQRTVHIIDMGKRIGYEGGSKGTGKALNKIKFVIEKGTNNEAVTVFPTK